MSSQQYAPPADLFPHFYGNPAIMAMADDRNWTVSDKDKRPLNAQALVYRGKIFGARAAEADRDLLTLTEMSTYMPWAANCACYFQSARTGTLVLDIESDCPDHVKRRLLALSRYALYTETSMSGQGYHLILRLPDNFHDFPDAAGRTVLKHPEGWYEILLDHWVTFTRNPIDPALVNAAVADPAHAELTIENVYAEMASSTRASAADGAAVSANLRDILDPGLDERTRDLEETIVNAAVREHVRIYAKTLADFSDDHSRWEFSNLSALARRIAEQCIAQRGAGRLVGDVDGNQATRMLYHAAQLVIPHRAKHDGTRSGMPYLMYQAANCIRITDSPHFTDADTPDGAHVRRPEPTAALPPPGDDETLQNYW